MEAIPTPPAPLPGETEQLDWSELPAGLRRIRDVAGGEAALALAEAFGGASFYVPRKVPPGHRLRRFLGEGQAAALSRIFGGERLDVPKTDAVFRQLRKRRIRQQRQEGASIASLATEHNLSRRRILQILAER